MSKDNVVSFVAGMVFNTLSTYYALRDKREIRNNTCLEKSRSSNLGN